MPFRPRVAALAPAEHGSVSGVVTMLATVAVLNMLFWTAVGNAALHSLA